MRSVITSGLLGFCAVSLTVASPGTASASWLSQLLRGNPIINNGGHINDGLPAYSNYADPNYQPQRPSLYAPHRAVPSYPPPQRIGSLPHSSVVERVQA